jgi:hypothetical protein
MIANCQFDLGEIAFYECQFALAEELYRNALKNYEIAGQKLGQANCHCRFGDLECRVCKDRDAPRGCWEKALGSYEWLVEPTGEGDVHVRLALISSDCERRKRHLTLARTAWGRIGLEDRVNKHCDLLQRRLL